ncbi:MAG: oligopeptide:H+ symporter [Syntrophus sp. SKADARSKE-3]|nr:oligopeptide:H+ symporter [Syntrophus sp. SKADARSKE-3]
MSEQSDFYTLLGLSGIEFWERFSFYTLSYLLPLYLVEQAVKGGMGFSESSALFWVGLYGFAAWSSPVVGGIFADRLFGLINALLIGGLMIISGHVLLFFIDNGSPLILFCGLLLVSIGTGLFKPSITGLVGEIFTARPNQRERAYSFYYSAINLGILASGIGGGLIVARYGYHWGFSAAGWGMIMAMLWFFKDYFTFKKKFSDIRNIRKHSIQRNAAVPIAKVRLVLAFSYISSWLWGCVYFLGIGGFLMLLIKSYTDRHVGSFEIPLSWFPSISPFFLIALTSIFSVIWKHLAVKGKEPSTFLKLAWGQFLCAATLGVLILALLKTNGVPPGTPALGCSLIAAFYIIGVVGEIFTCPISYSLISAVTGTKDIALRQAFCFACYGLGSITAGAIGALYFANKSIIWLLIIMTLIFIVFLVMLVLESRYVDWGISTAEALDSPEIGHYHEPESTM